jgi:hypothetical protein
MEKEQIHTSGNLRVLVGEDNELEPDNCYGSIVEEDGDSYIARVWMDGPNPKADARRLVACWNACSELLDTELSQGVVALHKFSYVVNEREEAKQQRNQLVEALQMAVEFANGIVVMQSLPNNGSVMKLIKLRQSALKSATGE